jgi:hypothetical protein
MQLVLLSKDPLNTDLVDGNGKTYHIHSSSTTTTITRTHPSTDPVYTMEGIAVYPTAHGIEVAVVGEFYWKSFCPSIMLYKGSEMLLKEYIKRNNIFSSKFTFTAADGYSYTWVTNHLGQLFVSTTLLCRSAHKHAYSHI